MFKKSLVLFVVVLSLLLTACGGGPAEVGVPEDAALKVTGNVENEVGWTEEDLRAMDAVDVESTNKDGETRTYTGVPINELLDKAGVPEGAETVSFVADDGYSADVPLSDVRGCSDCIISFRNQGGFSVVMPGFPGNVQVKGVVEIQVQ
jgi:hypothetical protein